jgi:hypothetical protein
MRSATTRWKRSHIGSSIDANASASRPASAGESGERSADLSRVAGAEARSIPVSISISSLTIVKRTGPVGGTAIHAPETGSPGMLGSPRDAKPSMVTRVAPLASGASDRPSSRYSSVVPPGSDLRTRSPGSDGDALAAEAARSRIDASASRALMSQRG